MEDTSALNGKLEELSPITTDYGITEAENQDLVKRFTYHALKQGSDQGNRYQVMRSIARNFAEEITRMCPNSREKSLALTKLEEAVMWANAAIARNEE